MTSQTTPEQEGSEETTEQNETAEKKDEEPMNPPVDADSDKPKTRVRKRRGE